MSVQTQIDRISRNVSAALSAIADKGVTVPDGSTSDALAGLIQAIQAGGGNIRIEQGSVTFAETVSIYTFVNDKPDIFIVYVEDDSKPIYSDSRYIWAIIQNTILFDYYGKQRPTMYAFGYNHGSMKYYTPYKCTYDKIGAYSSSNFNSRLGAKTYKWYAIYGVTAT